MQLISDMTKIVRDKSSGFGLDYKLIAALIQTESSWRPLSARYEKQFVWTKDVDKYAKLWGITMETEAGFQKFSWGLLQIMGGTARECGYEGWLPDLCEPAIGVHWGLLYFKKVSSRYISLSDQIAAYNMGRVKLKPDGSYINQPYVDRVLSAMKTS